jgi:hypothetical protein
MPERSQTFSPFYRRIRIPNPGIPVNLRIKTVTCIIYKNITQSRKGAKKLFIKSPAGKRYLAGLF